MGFDHFEIGPQQSQIPVRQITIFQDDVRNCLEPGPDGLHQLRIRHSMEVRKGSLKHGALRPATNKCRGAETPRLRSSRAVSKRNDGAPRL
jgi:hypothetical protein